MHKDDKIQLVHEHEMPLQIFDAPMHDPLSIYKVCMAMEEICEGSNAPSLSAPQVGIPWRVCVVKSDGTTPFAPKGEYGYFINCDYKPTNNQRTVSLEGCLSVRSPEGRLRYFQVERYTDIRVTGYRLFSNDTLIIDYFKMDFYSKGQAVLFQHEIDHNRPVLIKNLGKEYFLWS